MKLKDIREGMLVAYKPFHRAKATRVEVRELGTVRSVSKKYAFVKFAKDVAYLGAFETTAQPCLAKDLTEINLD